MKTLIQTPNPMNQFYEDLLTIAIRHPEHFAVIGNAIHISNTDTIITKGAQDFKTAAQIFHTLESIVYNSVRKCHIILEHENENYAATIYEPASDQEAIGGSTRSYAGALVNSYARYLKGEFFVPCDLDHVADPNSGGIINGYHH